MAAPKPTPKPASKPTPPVGPPPYVPKYGDAPASITGRDLVLLNTLEPVSRDWTIGLLLTSWAEGIDLHLRSAARTLGKQTGLTAGKNLPKANANASLHPRRGAIDVFIRINGKDVPHDQVPEATWQRVGAIGKKLGFVWGGDFKSIPRDPVHFHRLQARTLPVWEGPDV